MIQLYDDVNLDTHFIDLTQLKRILKRDRSSSPTGTLYDIKLTYIDGEVLDIVLDEPNVTILINAATS